MDAEQRGWYIQLLAESWENEPQATLPNDDAFLRVLAGVNTCSADVEQRWNVVKAQFKQKGKLLLNDRLLDEFAKQEENREKKRLAGQASAEARKAKREAIKAQHLNGNAGRNTRSTPVEIRSVSVPTERQQNSTLQSSSSIPISTPSSSSIKERERPAKKQQDERLRHPALVAIREVKGKFPSKDVWDMLIEKIGTHPDVPRMKECWLAWRTRNYQPENLGWLVDWYFEGIPERNGNGTSKQNGYQSPNERRDADFRGYAAVVSELRGESSGAVDETVRRKSLTS
jgi:uncharacterized protein YdaU (DUF1376 family)